MPISHHADTRMAFTPRLTGKTVVMFVDFSFEDMEVMYPKIRLEEEGARVIVSGAHPAGMKYTGRVRSFPHLLSVAVAAKGRCSSASMSMLHYLPLVCAPVSPPPPVGRQVWLPDRVGRYNLGIAAGGGCRRARASRWVCPRLHAPQRRHARLHVRHGRRRQAGNLKGALSASELVCSQMLPPI